MRTGFRFAAGSEALQYHDSWLQLSKRIRSSRVSLSAPQCIPCLGCVTHSACPTISFIVVLRRSNRTKDDADRCIIFPLKALGCAGLCFLWHFNMVVLNPVPLRQFGNLNLGFQTPFNGLLPGRLQLSPPESKPGAVFRPPRGAAHCQWRLSRVCQYPGSESLRLPT